MKQEATHTLRTWTLCLFALLAAPTLRAQQTIPELEQPRLVVGLVIDQMRWDYLTRFADRYGDGGSRRIMRAGYNCNRTFINYLPAITAVGHTSVWTGTVPAFHGITGNHIYKDGRRTYCTNDSTVRGVGSLDRQGRPDPRAYGSNESPRNMKCTTIGDELRLATNFRSKVVGVALKDRASILPAGHSATAAYWMDDKSMNFITSTYYMQELPQWVSDFNAQQLGEKYMKNLSKGHWPLLYDEDSYVQSAPKNQRWEDRLDGSLKQSPWGMTITFDMARAAVEGEGLGHNPAGVPDMLCVSISSTDMIGHQLSPNSIWMEDLYLRLDRDLEAFFNFLDERVGRGQWLFFLTADHAGFHNTEFMREHRLPAGTWPSATLADDINETVCKELSLSEKPVERIRSMQVHFTAAAKQSPRYADIVDATCRYLRSLPFMAYAFPADQVPTVVPEPVRTMCVNGYCPGRSGEVQLVFQPGVMEDYASAKELAKPDHIRLGTTHSVWSPDDTHIPLAFLGWHVPHGWDNRRHHIVDIAATVAALLNIQEPNCCTGQVIDFSSK